MGETRVDLHHLLEDLRDAYPESIEETIVTEIVANALDSKATTISFTTDREAATLTVVDDGAGMTRRDLRSYHDLAATTKQRGRGIGFAGVGIKLGLLACETVMTETRRGKTHCATTWRLSSKRRAPWSWMPPQGWVTERGTAVRLSFNNPLSELLDSGAIESMLCRHFVTLLDPAFADVLRPYYPDGVRFSVDGRSVAALSAPDDAAPLEIRVGRKRKPSATGFMFRAVDLPEPERGIAVSTLGKVIKRGWDWVGASPSAPDEIGGILEVPALAACLTLNKADFIRTGDRGALYLAHRGAIQQVVQTQLAEWGDGDRAGEEKLRRKARPVERDIENVLADLADDYPLLASLVERHRGGQRRLPIGAPGKGAIIPVTPLDGSHVHAPRVSEVNPEDDPGVADGAPPGEPDAPPPPPPLVQGIPGGRGRKKPARYALTIRFEDRPEDPGLGRLIESTVWVNKTHPAYERAERTRAEPYHIALTVAMTLAPLAVEADSIHLFVTEFLARWGTGDLGRKKGGPRSKSKPLRKSRARVASVARYR